MTASIRRVLVLALMVLLCGAGPVFSQSREDTVVRSATVVLDEIMAVPVKRIPESLLADCQGLVIIPNLVKGGFVIGVRHGRGVALVKDETGAWKPPQFVTMTGGSVGWQAGLQATDVILVFRTQKSVRNLMNGKFTIGADAAAAAGPVGRQAAAATDTSLRAEILSYSRSRGLFAGVSLDGSALQIDAGANQAYYGAVPPGQAVQLPESARRLTEQVVRYTSASPSAPGGTVTPPPLTAPAPPAIGDAAAQDDAAIRRELAPAVQQLQPLLDENWKRYLALPATVTAGNAPAPVEALQNAIQRFDTVAKDPRYLALAQRPEFQTVYGLLKKYLSLRSTAPATSLSLPPPPSGASTGVRLPRY